MDKSINFSHRMGILVHGVIGYNFFKHFIFDVNYSKEYIKIYPPESYTYRKCKKCYQAKLYLREQKKKPFIVAQYLLEKRLIDITLLLDMGSGSSLGLFNNKKKEII